MNGRGNYGISITHFAAFEASAATLFYSKCCRGHIKKRMIDKKKLLKGCIHQTLISPVRARPKTIKKPQGSIRLKVIAWR
jgi:hypothetical protein